VAVIGGGLAGLAAARTLADQNHAVVVFEKARGRGGRAATRRLPDVPGGAASADHGAQYFTARDPRFRRRVLSWAARGVLARWEGRFGAVGADGIQPAGEGDERWVGVPGMSALGRMLADDLDLRLSTRVAPPERIPDGWLLMDESGAELGRFDRVLVAAPAPQAADLLAAAPGLAARAAAVPFNACWTVLAGFAVPVSLPWDGLFVNAGPLGWVARDGGKPGRQGEIWVLHAAPDWSRGHLEDAPASVADTLLGGFRALAGGDLPPVSWQEVHRWLFARAAGPLDAGCLWDGDHGIGACGDWCTDGRIEGAWLSGEALAGRVLGAAAAVG
jgi:predicted NAD/FAD-dependent oxidoreductase